MGTWFSDLQAVVQAWQPMQRSWSMTLAHFIAAPPGTRSSSESLQPCATPGTRLAPRCGDPGRRKASIGSPPHPLDPLPTLRGEGDAPSLPLVKGSLVLTGVRLVLLDLAQHPVELAAGDLGVAVGALPRHVHLERRTAVGTVLVGARRAAHAGAADQRPVLGVVAVRVRVAARHLAGRLADGEIAAAGPDAERHRVVVPVADHLGQLQARQAHVAQLVGQALVLVGGAPVLQVMEGTVREDG